MFKLNVDYRERAVRAKPLKTKSKYTRNDERKKNGTEKKRMRYWNDLFR